MDIRGFQLVELSSLSSLQIHNIDARNNQNILTIDMSPCLRSKWRYHLCWW